MKVGAGRRQSHSLTPKNGWYRVVKVVVVVVFRPAMEMRTTLSQSSTFQVLVGLMILLKPERTLQTKLSHGPNVRTELRQASAPTRSVGLSGWALVVVDVFGVV